MFSINTFESRLREYLNETFKPFLFFEILFLIITCKEPSPLVNPETQKGSGIPLKIYSGLFTGTTFEKDFF